MAAIEAALAQEEKTIVAVTQTDGEGDNIGPDDLFRVGTKAVIKKFARSEDALELMVQGLERVSVSRFEPGDAYLKAVVEPLPLFGSVG